MKQFQNSLNYVNPAHYKHDAKSMTRPNAAPSIKDVLNAAISGEPIKNDRSRVGQYESVGNFLFKTKLDIVETLEEVTEKVNKLIQVENEQKQKQQEEQFNKKVEEEVQKRSAGEPVAKTQLDV